MNGINKGPTARSRPYCSPGAVAHAWSRRDALVLAGSLAAAGWAGLPIPVLAKSIAQTSRKGKKVLSKRDAWDAYAKVHAAWNSASVDERVRLAAEILDENVEYQTVRHDTVFGRETVIADMAVFHERFPGGHFEIGDVSAHHNVALLTWVLIQADGTEFARGGDMITIGTHGKITKITTFGPSSKTPD